MRVALIFILLMLAACEKKIVGKYESYNDVLNSSLIDKGWVPAFIPKNATNIIESHSVDIGEMNVVYNFHGNQYFSSGFEIKPLEKIEINQILERIKLPEWSDFSIESGSQLFFFCGDSGVGVLIVSPLQGKAFYREPVVTKHHSCQPDGSE
jgi:hypothetical protein